MALAEPWRNRLVGNKKAHCSAKSNKLHEPLLACNIRGPSDKRGDSKKNKTKPKSRTSFG